MGDVFRSLLLGAFDHLPSNTRSREGSTEQIPSLIFCVRFNGGPDKFFDELFATVIDINL